MNILDQKEVVGKKSKAPTSEVVDKKSKAPTSIAQIKRQVKHYADWFSAENQRNALASTAREKKDYIESATKVVKVGEKDVMVFAPFRPDHSALQTITTAQVVVLCAIALVCGFGLVWLRLELLAIMMAALTAFYLFHLLLDVIQAALTLRSSAEKQIDMEVIHALKDADWPNYTILCPLYREVEVVPQFVEAMKALEYPVDKLQILLLTEEDDAETRNAMRAMQLPPHFKVVTVPDGSPRTKPRACNYGLMIAMGRYTVIYDAEDIPDPWQLKKAVLTFANHDPDLACVQAKLNFYNPYQNLLTRLFTIEYSLWFDFILPGLQRVGFSLPLGGTSNHFQTQVLRALGGWDAYNVTEDCDLGIRLASYRFKTVVLDSTTYEEANSQLKNWIRQRSRWIKGYMQTYLVQMRHPFRALSKGRFRELASLQLVIAAGMWTFLFNPLLWTLLAVYIVARPLVEGLYHTLFPAPVLYMGTLCLIFGNFFYLYLCMIGCMKVKRYHLVKWVLLVPFYWIMMSVAAGLSLFQLIVKPHYWEKTKHGLHLKGKQPLTGLTWLSAQDLAKEETIQEETIQEETLLLTAVADARIKKVVSTITEALLAMPTLSMPAFSRAQRAAIVQSQRTKVRDLWLPVTVITACVASIAAWWYYFQQHETLLYADAYSHLRIARSVVDSATPGFNQLGGVWLPMHHMLMLPFVWNDFLWKTGLAGSIPSMVSYVVAALYLFLFARRFTNDGFACFLGILTFLLNPNILYLQSTPLSELVCVATTLMACYYYLVWVQEDTTTSLILAAVSSFVATLVRYDSWQLFIVLFLMIIVVGWRKKQGWGQIQAHLLVFGTLGALGIGLWLLWCKTIFGDPLYFQHGPYSAAAQQIGYIRAHVLYTYHNIWQAFRYYSIDSYKMFGLSLFILASVAIAVFIFKNRFKLEGLVALILLLPFGFYVLNLYTGQAILYVPAALPANVPAQWFNTRYGTQMIAPLAFFLAVLLGNWFAGRRRTWRTIVQVAFCLVLFAQTLLTVSGGILALDDPLHSGSCALASRPVNIYLAQHYNGGKILTNEFTNQINAQDFGANVQDIIYEGSGELWRRALSSPATVVDWVIINPGDKSDVIAQHINSMSQAFLTQFALAVQQSDGLQLYYRRGLPSLPQRPVPSDLLANQQLCRPYKHV